ncbi:MAG: rhomboid family intramembrane serine protease [Candidatus Eisenbacteria bacterium]|nr:rhomboid family intramembrane serine protease [Candidatus Eisenbacteria bacterium]
MIPLKDNNPRFSTPYVTWGLIAANVLVFFYEVALGPHGMRGFVSYFGLIPLRAFQPEIFMQAVFEHARYGQLVAVDLPPRYLPFLSSMFMHGGWLHLGGNMLYLYVFGDNVEDALGHVRYLFFYLVCGVGASLAHCWVAMALRPGDALTTVVGASGAVAGVLGAYIYMYPRARVLTLVPVFVFLQMIELPAQLVLGLWFVIQFFSGVGSLGRYAGGGVAFWAHIGGFVLGLGLAMVLPRRRRPRAIYL